MLGKLKPNFQQNLFQTRLTDLINLEHPLVKLALELDWSKIEAELKNYIQIKEDRQFLSEK